MTIPSPQSNNCSDSDLELLSAYLDNQLTAVERVSFEKRLSTEPALQSELESLRTMTNLLRNLDTVTLPRSFTLDASQEAPRRTIFPVWAWAGSAFAALLLVALTTTLLTTSMPAQEQSAEVADGSVPTSGTAAPIVDPDLDSNSFSDEGFAAGDAPLEEAAADEALEEVAADEAPVPASDQDITVLSPMTSVVAPPAAMPDLASEPAPARSGEVNRPETAAALSPGVQSLQQTPPPSPSPLPSSLPVGPQIFSHGEVEGTESEEEDAEIAESEEMAPRPSVRTSVTTILNQTQRTGITVSPEKTPKAAIIAQETAQPEPQPEAAPLAPDAAGAQQPGTPLVPRLVLLLALVVGVLGLAGVWLMLRQRTR